MATSMHDRFVWVGGAHKGRGVIRQLSAVHVFSYAQLLVSNTDYIIAHFQCKISIAQHHHGLQHQNYPLSAGFVIILM